MMGKYNKIVESLRKLGNEAKYPNIKN